MKISFVFILLTVIISSFFLLKEKNSEEEILFHIVDPQRNNVAMYWKDDTMNIASLRNLKTHLEAKNQTLLFATNGGMYMQDLRPLGLYIEDHLLVRKLNTVQDAYGNFYLQPNGVFYLTDSDSAFISASTDFRHNKNIKYATQSGPMLLIDGTFNPNLTKGSKNLHIRNGVGILSDGKIVFAMSKKRINFYDFASFFKEKGCKNALYFDGFVSRTYLPEKEWIQTDGNFGVIIGVTNK